MGTVKIPAAFGADSRLKQKRSKVNRRPKIPK